MCPNGAIQRSARRFRIEPLLCTECLFYDDEPACAAACPHGAVYPDHETNPEPKGITHE
jgi:Fe-S-cluster-containing hydrogenase component 2